MRQHAFCGAKLSVIHERSEVRSQDRRIHQYAFFEEKLSVSSSASLMNAMHSFFEEKLSVNAIGVTIVRSLRSFSSEIFN